MNIKSCSTCQREYIPSSRHKQCPKCRGILRRTKCQCGELKRKRSIQCSKCVSRDKTLHPSWKGGRTNLRGYTQVRMPEHPRTSKATPYIFEHILVMEQKLGRYLNPGETIHHKNGVRDDNRIENLELWVSNHPSGQRVSDLVEWAHEIIERYKEL